MSRPVYTIIAGSNGSGKSTFRHLYPEFIVGDIVDPDVISIQLSPGLSKLEKDAAAARKAIEICNKCLEDKISFLQETTLSGRCININKNITLARLQGYDIRLIYLAVESSDIAIRNINERVKNGGHHIDDSTVKKRFEQSYKNLLDISKRVNKINVFDNSSRGYNELLSIENGHILFKDSNMPSWINNTCNQVIKNSREINKEKVFRVSNADYEKLKDVPGIKINPYEANKDKATVLVNDENIIKNFLREITLLR